MVASETFVTWEASLQYPQAASAARDVMPCITPLESTAYMLPVVASRMMLPAGGQVGVSTGTGMGWQPDWSASGSRPGAQERHCEMGFPVERTVPDGQGIHPEAPAGRYCPGGHDEGEGLPLGQSSQASSAARLTPPTPKATFSPV